MATTFADAVATLATTIAGLTLAYPAATSQRLREFGGRIEEEDEGDFARHRHFQIQLGGSKDGATVTSAERDVAYELAIVVHYDADQSLIAIEKFMASDSEVLAVQLEKATNWPTGVRAITWLGSDAPDRSDAMHPVRTNRFLMTMRLAQ